MAEQVRDIVRRLQAAGLRLTPQRLLILETLQATGDHISAEEILQRVRERYPFVNRSTVYRTLEALRELQLVAAAHFGDGGVRYHWAEKGRHHHLVCQHCGAVMELDEGLTKELSRLIERDYSFQANLSHLTIFGNCHSCRS